MTSVAIITTCKGRLAFLKQTLPLMVATGFPVTVVDYDQFSPRQGQAVLQSL
jgi:hypothetical protein